MSLRDWKAEWVRIAVKVWAREEGDVSVGKVSRTESGLLAFRVLEIVCRDSGRRARRAMARLPCEGWERMRAMPVPYCRGWG